MVLKISLSSKYKPNLKIYNYTVNSLSKPQMALTFILMQITLYKCQYRFSLHGVFEMDFTLCLKKFSNIQQGQHQPNAISSRTDPSIPLASRTLFLNNGTKQG